MNEQATLRDLFAMAAVQGLLAADKGALNQRSPADVAKWAYSCADAMLAERMKPWGANGNG